MTKISPHYLLQLVVNTASALNGRLVFRWAFLTCAILFCSQPFSSPLSAAHSFANFITTKDGKLMDGDQPLRFISFNIPNLSYTEDNLQFDQTSGFRLPTPYEIDDALATIHQMGGQVARIYVLSVHKT